MNLINIEPEYLLLVKNILQNHLPPHVKVWIFGSRLTPAIKKFSDIDLLIDLGEPISFSLLADLRDAFDESELPYKVDLVDWHSVDQNFREKIMSGGVLL